jgi:hypothetical protein
MRDLFDIVLPGNMRSKMVAVQFYISVILKSGRVKPRQNAAKGRRFSLCCSSLPLVVLQWRYVL